VKERTGGKKQRLMRGKKKFATRKKLVPKVTKELHEPTNQIPLTINKSGSPPQVRKLT